MSIKPNKTRIALILSSVIITLGIAFYSYQRTNRTKMELKIAEEKRKQEELKKENEKSTNTQTEKTSVPVTENNVTQENPQNIGNIDNSDIKEMRDTIIDSGSKEYEANLISRMQKTEEKLTDRMQASSSTNELKVLVQELYDEWDSELNKVYKLVMEILPENSKTTLRNSQREWIDNRDREAEETAKEAGGVLTYTNELANITKERTIQLAKLYDRLRNR